MQYDSVKKPRKSGASILAARRRLRVALFVCAALFVVPWVIAVRCLVAGVATWVQCVLVAITSGRLEV